MQFNDKARVFQETLLALNKGYRLIIHQGGTYAGKTYSSLAAMGVWIRDKNINGIVVGQAVPELKGGAHNDWEEINNYFGFAECVNKTDREYAIGNSRLKFTTIDTVGKAKSGKRGFCFINECNHIPWDIAEQLILKSDVVILDYNPTHRFWLHKHILPKIEIYQPYLITKTTYKDNPSVSEQKKREIESFESDPYKYSVYALGELGKHPGVVFEKYNTFHGDLPDGSKRGCFLDYGYTNDVTALGEAIILGDKIYCREIIYETGLLTRDINNLMVQNMVIKGLPIYADNIPKENAELSTYGWKIIPTKKFAGSVKFGIGILKQYQIHVHTGSINAMNEMDNYTYIKNRDGEFINEPIDKYNHFIDGLRYYAMVNASSAVTSMSKRYYSENLI